MLSVRMHDPVPEQSPFQPAKSHVASVGVAVSVTVVPGSKRWVQVALVQVNPGGELTTVPPAPTITVKVVWVVSKMAVTVVGVVRVTVQGPAPEQALLQLRNLQPAAGVAVSVMGVCGGMARVRRLDHPVFRQFVSCQSG